MTLLETEALDTAAEHSTNIIVFYSLCKDQKGAILQGSPANYEIWLVFCYFKCFISEYLSKYDSSFFTDRTKGQIQKQKEKLWCSGTESTCFVPCN